MSQSLSATDTALGALANPFQDAVLGSAWEPEGVDVSEIHAGVFQTMKKAIDERAQGVRGPALLVYGDAGSGKTHLLRRLRLHIEGRSAGDSAPEVLFCFVRMLTSPRIMWRHLRKQLCQDLVRQEIRGRTQISWLLSLRKHRMDELERDLSVALDHLAAGRHVRDARAWLIGDRLPEDALRQLGIASASEEEEAEEKVAHDFILSLARWIAPAPLVICLDQLEGLQAHPGDKAGLFSIGKILTDLHDELGSAVVIGCAQTGLLHDLQSNISKAEQDRMLPVVARPLTLDEVGALIAARLARQPQIAARRPAGAPPYWPLDLNAFRPLVNSPTGVTPRKVMHECAVLYRRQQGAPPAPERSLDAVLEDLYAQRWHAALNSSATADSDDILSTGLPKVLHVRGCRIRREGLPPWTDHEFTPRGESKPTAVALANGPTQSVARRLLRIQTDWSPLASNLMLVRDSRDGIGAGAKKTLERLDALRQKGARLVQPSPEALAALDALRTLLADAESGDLAHAGASISVPDVEHWILQHTPDAVSRLLDELSPAQDAQAPPPDSRLALEMGALLDNAKLMTIAAVAQSVGRTTEEVTRCARENPDQFGFLGGTVPVVFQRLPEFRED
jgi:hypothetical protein